MELWTPRLHCLLRFQTRFRSRFLPAGLAQSVSRTPVTLVRAQRLFSGTNFSISCAGSFLHCVHIGIKVDQSWTYTASVNFKFAEGSTFSGSLTASLVGSDGTVFASASQDISASTSWTEFSVKLTPTASAPDTDNSFRLTVDGAAASGETIFFSLFSLFPPTLNDRPNGIRVDLAQVSLLSLEVCCLSR